MTEFIEEVPSPRTFSQFLGKGIAESVAAAAAADTEEALEGIVTVLTMKVRAALFSYSEWLDADQKLFRKPKRDDMRSHDDLVREFLVSA